VIQAIEAKHGGNPMRAADLVKAVGYKKPSDWRFLELLKSANQYRDVFSPAIKDAGLEPVRADELFSTGTVIEQIWEQIRRAKVLLADLTGKNANVFYELGLAHAKRKPVVFTSGKLEDVPFDLRHLRVIIYDLQDPFWGEKLKKNLSAYLKHARSEPDKSIPQPFRQLEKEDDENGGS
jgi:hypothetical protein